MSTTTLQGFRLSAQQRRLWQQRGQGAVFCVQEAVRIDGALDLDRLQQALEQVVARHEALHTLFVRRPGMKLPLQTPSPEAAGVRFEAKTLSEPITAELARRRLERLRRRPFDLEAGPLVWAQMFSHEASHLLLLAMPSLAADGASMAVVLGELERAYLGELPPADDEDPLQYAHFSDWQEELAEADDDEAANGRERWRREEAATLALPLEVPGLAPPSPRPRVDLKTRRLGLEAPVVARLTDLAQARNLRLAAVIAAVWSALLMRLADRSGLALRWRLANRPFDDLDEAVGLFAKHLPVVVQTTADQTLAALAEQLADTHRQAEEWQEYAALEPSEDETAVALPVFAFDDLTSPQTFAGLTVERLERFVWSCATPLALIGRRTTDGLVLDLVVDKRRLEDADLQRLAGRLERALDAAADAWEQPLTNLDVLTDDERQELATLGGLPFEAPAVSTVLARVAEQVASNPEEVAVLGGGRSLDYATLWQRSGALAVALEASGLAREEPVGLLLERGVDSVVALLAVWRSGGAYLPLDPDLPAPRLARLMTTAGATRVVVSESTAERAPEEAEVLSVELASAGEGVDVEPRSPAPETDQLAYILFTSGSTGVPKGVQVTHGNLASYVAAVETRLKLDGVDRWAVVSSFAADLGNTALFPPLCRGGSVCMVTAEEASDPAAFGRVLAEGAVDGLKIVPSHLRALLSGEDPAQALPRKLLVLGGEATSPELLIQLRELAPGMRVVNHYGPTEATVGATACVLGADQGDGPIPLGRPLANAVGVVLDRRGQLVPWGVAGELCLGGAGISRGYLGGAAATAERFIPDAWSGASGARLYRTGDLARVGSAGFEFRGRIDHQVKLRGFRIELGEIEALLRRQDGVAEAVVLLRQDGDQGARLVGYGVAEPGSSLDTEALRRRLAQELPEAMVPAALVELDQLPLNANGKVDRGALPAPEEAVSRAEYEAPRDALEETLARIWSKVLGVPQVGIHDGFFALGGDSILAIQVVGQANREGLVLTPQLLFRHQTLAELAPHVTVSDRSAAASGPVVGPGLLTPIQHWFFDFGFRHPERWNQSFLFELAGGDLDVAALQGSIERLVEHHDGLRAGFDRSSGEVAVHFAAPGGAVPFSIIDLSGLDLSELDTEARNVVLLRSASAVQGSFRLDQPPLLRVVWFAGAKPADGRLLIVAHHLVIDGVSWRVLLEDLETCYQALSEGRDPELPAKTASVRDWGEQLRRLANAPEMALEGEHWLALPTDAAAGLPPDHEGENSMASASATGRAFPKEATRALLQEVPAVYNTRIDEVLLTALAQAMVPWIGDRPLLVELEGHGREDRFAGVDLSRTIGWFTTHYPVALPAVANDPPGRALMRVKETLRAAPGGLGFGVLHTLSDDPAVRQALDALPVPTLGFNYLGQLDRVLQSDGPLRVAPEVLTGDTHPRELRPRRIDLGISVVAERLQIRFTFSEALYDRSTIEELLERYRNCLLELVAHCQTPGVGANTPSDFPLVDFDLEGLAAFEDSLRQLDAGEDGAAAEGRVDLEDLYPLTPLQESLLYHATSVPGSGVGFEQSVSTLGGALDRQAFDKTWRRVVERHPILRTSVVTDPNGRPLQRVRRQVEMVVEHLDWSDRSATDQEQGLERLLRQDRERGFDLARAPLMRVVLIRLAEERHQFVWSYHHLILDGWCRGLVLDEVFTLYDAFSRGVAPKLPNRRPFRDYLEWLGAQDQNAAEAFWRRTVGALEAPTDLAVDRLQPGETGGERYRWADGELDEAASDRLEAYAREHGLTLNSLVQGTWALLASRYSGERRVVHGTTVAGRPTDLEGTDGMLGMFVNNLPVSLEVDEDALASQWFRGVQEQLVELQRFEFSAPSQIQEWSGLGFGQRLFDVLVLFQNYPIGDVGEELTSRSLRIEDYRSRLETNYALTLGIGRARPLILRLFFDARRYDAESAQRLLTHLQQLLEGLVQGDDPTLRDLVLDPAPEVGTTPLEVASDPLAELAVTTATPTWPQLLEALQAEGDTTPETAIQELPTVRLASGREARFRREALNQRLAALATPLSAEDVLWVDPTGVPEAVVTDRLLAKVRGAQVLWESTSTPPEEATAWRATPGQLVAALAAGWAPGSGFRVLVRGELPAAGLVAHLAATGAEVWLADLEYPVQRLDPESTPAVDHGSLIEEVVDGRGRPTVAGVPGEIVLRGPGAPDGDEDGNDGPFRTGRRGRRLPSGTVEALRTVDGDRQTARDAEVEALLARHPSVLQARLLHLGARQGSVGGDTGIAVVATRPGESLDTGALRRHLTASLPPAWLPASFLSVPSLPLDTRGAVDRAGLAELDLGALEESFVAPRDPRQLALVRLFEELFERRPIGIRDSFFELGGHSLMALRLLARVRSTFAVDLPLGTLLEAPTVEALARCLEEASATDADAPAEHQPLVPIAPHGDKPPLFCIHPGGGNVLCYTDLAYRLGDEQPIYGLEARGRDAGQTPRTDVVAMARDYVAALRGLQAEGPYHLAGWSFGGLVAYEMARQLRAAGQEVAWVALFDTLLREGEYPLSDSELLHTYLGEELPIPLAELVSQGSLDEQLAFALDRAKAEGFLPADYPLDHAKRLFDVRKTNIRAGVAYTPEPSDVRLILFRARDRDEAGLADDYGWGRTTASVEVCEVPGEHATMLRAPHVESLAAALRGWLG